MVKLNLEANTISIDMIDLVIDLSVYEFEMMVKPIVDTLKLDVHIEYWESFGWNKYRHNWRWSVDNESNKYSFFFSYSSNISEDLKTRFRLSYNPNKVSSCDRVLSYLLNIFRFEMEQVRIQSCDVAMDYEGVTTSDLTFDKGRKREYKIMKYPNSDLTYYIGNSRSGHIKVYDKANEETKNKNEMADYNKTRYEVTVKDTIEFRNLDEWNYKGELPILYINQVVGLFDNKKLSPTDRLLLYSVENGFPMDKLTKEQRRKYKKLISEVEQVYTKIEPSQRRIEMALKEFMAELIY